MKGQAIDYSTQLKRIHIQPCSVPCAGLPDGPTGRDTTQAGAEENAHTFVDGEDYVCDRYMYLDD